MDASLTIADKYNIDYSALDHVTINGGNGTTLNIIDNSITTAKINDLAVTDGKINTSAVTTVKLNDLSITSAKIPTGTIITAKIANGAITNPKLTALNYQNAFSYSGSWSATGSFTDITSQSITITTNGRPVVIMFCPTVTDTNGSGVFLDYSVGVPGQGILKLMRDANVLSYTQYYNNSGASITMPCNFLYVDAVAAGTYTYKFQGMRGSASAVTFTALRLFAYEL